jgi:hypothetical protein
VERVELTYLSNQMLYLYELVNERKVEDQPDGKIHRGKRESIVGKGVFIDQVEEGI